MAVSTHTYDDVLTHLHTCVLQRRPLIVAERQHIAHRKPAEPELLPIRKNLTYHSSPHLYTLNQNNHLSEKKLSLTITPHYTYTLNQNHCQSEKNFYHPSPHLYTELESLPIRKKPHLLSPFTTNTHSTRITTSEETYHP